MAHKILHGLQLLQLPLVLAAPLLHMRVASLARKTRFMAL
nr:MAG TPA: hypothetical protein [Caudoviricetes sp.]